MVSVLRKAKEGLEEFFLRISVLSAEATTIQPAKAGPGPTDANGSPIEEPAEVDQTKPSCGALHPKHITGI